MTTATPHFLLFSESTTHPRDSDRQQAGRWRFVLESIDGDATIAAGGAEPDAHGERLELLAVVRGLEALDQPSKVTLVTHSDYVRRGLRYGLNEWKCNQWRWERFGRMVPVKNGDLWQRVDRALSFHKVLCRRWRFNGPERQAEERPVEERQRSATESRPAADHRAPANPCKAARTRHAAQPTISTIARAGLRWCGQVTAPHGRRLSPLQAG